MIVWNDSERSTSGSRLSSTLAVSSVDTNESLSLALGLGDGGGSVTMAMSVVTGINAINQLKSQQNMSQLSVSACCSFLNSIRMSLKFRWFHS